MSEEPESEESRRDTQWDLDFRACVAGMLVRGEEANSSSLSAETLPDLLYDEVIGRAAELADRMRAKRLKRPIGPPESEIRKKHRLLVDAVKEAQEVFQRRDMQACPIPIALSRALDELFDALSEKKKEP